jgi:hypothetical protein
MKRAQLQRCVERSIKRRAFDLYMVFFHDLDKEPFFIYVTFNIDI